MIDSITKLLRLEGLLETEASPMLNFLFTRGTCIVATATLPDGRAYFLKCSEISDLSIEFGLIEEAQRLYPDFVPHQYGHFRLNDISIILSDYVSFSTVSATCISPSATTAVRDYLLDFFTNTGKSDRGFGQNSTSLPELFSNVDKSLEPAGFGGFLNKWIQCSELENLDPLPQHGDFVHNNFGLSKNGLYIFDWEDYGKVCLPGLDLATFIIADNNFCADAVFDIMCDRESAGSHYQSFVAQGCSAISLDRDLFLRLLPVYTAIFLHLKHEYGAEIQSTIRKFLKQLLVLTEA